MPSFASFVPFLAQSAQQEGWIRIVVAVLIVAGSFGIGKWLSKVWRMPDYSFRFGLILFTVIAGVVVCAWRWPPKLGIDLKGGVILIYEVAEQEDRALPAGESLDMDKLIAALNLRVNPGGQKEVVVRKFGERQVEIIVPEVDSHEIELIKKKISTAGLLEFRIVANNVRDERAIELAQKSSAKLVYDGKELVAKWVSIDPKQIKSTEGMITRKNEAGETEVLMRVDPYNVTGERLRAYAGHDQVGQPAVDFSFEADRAVAFGQFTEENAPDRSTGFKQRLGIVLDNRLFSAPGLEEAITSRGQIHGSFTVEEVQFLVDILNAGSLPAALDKKPVSETTISPQLGEDTIRNGSITMIVSTLMILVFMAIYYRFSGLVADLAVVMNVLLVLALMITLGAAFTLAGLAGLVLSVGMAVDANVLIYERMREELQRGAALRMAIRNGFGRAMATIVDSNLTTLLTGVVLYAIGTDQLKGFAITLILGLLLNLYTAVYAARAVFDVAERRRWISELRMMRMFEAPNWDFVRPTKYAITASLLIIIGGMVAAGTRGEGLFGIDFTGGTSVQIVLDENHKLTVSEVREIVDPSDESKPRLEDVTVASVGTGDADGKSRYYKIDTSVQDIEEVKTRLQKMFGDKLEVYELIYTEPQKIANRVESATGESGARTANPEPNAEATKKESDSEKSGKSETPSSAVDEKSTAPKTPPSKPDQKANDAPVPLDAKKDQGTDGGGSAPSDTKAKQPQAFGLPRSTRLLDLFASSALAVVQDEAPTKSSDSAPKSGTTSNAAPEPTGDAKADAKQPAGNKAADQSDGAAPSGPSDTTKAKDATEPLQTQPTATKPPSDKSATRGITLPNTPTRTAERDAAADTTFAGGSAVQLNFKEGINRDALAARLETTATDLKLQPAQFALEEVKGTQDELNSRLFKSWRIKTTLQPADTGRVLTEVKRSLAETPIFLGANTIGGKVAGHAQIMAIYAILASMVMIVIYVWVRFQNIVFGLAAVVALVHDVLVTIAALAVSYYIAPYFGWAMVDPFKISLDVVAALLTIVGFSINDTIVIFDRIREIKGKSPEVTMDMVNKAVNQTLGRTILTSGTVLIVTIILYVWGGQEIHPFAFAMLVGLVSGTYSTIYIASPLVLFLRKPTATRKPVTARTQHVAMRA